ncbi:MAG: response regulator transcription factor [Pedobacter sp.]|nr:MAG: response regulator transcription factor [Pedobacter sp.]
MVLKCVAIDDEPLALQLIKTYAERIPAIQLKETFDDGISGIEYLNQHPVDLLFLDINMPDITGIELASALIHKPLIIFTTAYKQFAYEGFQLEAVDYLLKPIQFDSFSKAVQKAVASAEFKDRSSSIQNDAAIYVHSEYRLLKIFIREIEYIESMEDYVRIHVGTEQPILSLITLKKVLEMLPLNQFVRIHRSFVINTARIKSISQRKVQMQSSILPIGDSYASQLQLAIRQ